MKIAVCLQSRNHFGAQIVHIPALVEIKRLHPDAEIIAFSKFAYSKFLKELGYVDQIHIGKGLFFYLNQFRKNKIEAIYSLQRSSKSIDLAALLLRIKGYIKYAPDSIEYTKEIYRAKALHQLISDSPESYRSACMTIRHRFLKANRYSYYVVIPGAGGKEKRVGLDILLQSINQFRTECHLEPVFILGPEENEEASLLATMDIKTIRSPSVHELFDIIINSTFVLSVDCGPSHVAHIACHPQIVMFIKTLNEWFDYRTNNLAIDGKGKIDSITSGQILEAMNAILNRLNSNA